ncbi:hypothetical protein PG996_012618 [Apiospora saccharicola]|uniref:Uncharacterized protein n=1 Tax=Apiospora saccharicola TaxID=335842 RepID=A0ABR1U3P5_9PEZI
MAVRVSANILRSFSRVRRPQPTLRKPVFINIHKGVLASASESLLAVSDWLLSKVTELGLATDNYQLHHDRIKLWHDFNHAWLALLQKQKDMVGSGIVLQRDQTLVSEERLEEMGEKLVRLCDGITGHGLVDYEYGVWEELIIHTDLEVVLMECLDFYESTDGSGNASLTNPSSSSLSGDLDPAHQADQAGPLTLAFPADIIFLPFYVVFTYVHSGMKLRALFTFWDLEWAGRKLERMTKIALE